MKPEAYTSRSAEEAAEATGTGGAIRLAGRRSILGEAVDGLRRNSLMAAAATVTMAVALSVAGWGMIVSANLVHVAGVLESQVEVVGFLRRDLGAAESKRALAAARAIPSVRSAVLVDRDEAMRRLGRTFGSLARVSKQLPANPLPDSIEVRVSDARHARAVAGALRGVAGVDEVMFGAPVVDRLVALTRAVRLAGAGVAALLAGAALLIIINTIRLTVVARRQEIEIMTLVGAAPGFVRGPFLVEGALQGLAASAVATAIMVAGYSAVAGGVTRSLPFLPILEPRAVLPEAVAAIWLLGAAVGFAGSLFGIRRFLGA